MEDKELKFRLDVMGLIGLILSFVSILLSFNLSTSDIAISTGIFLVMIAKYIYLSLNKIINKQGEEIKKINENFNIQGEISELKAKVDLLMNYLPHKMKNKRGRSGDITEILIRIIQILGIAFAFYIILKALNLIP
ncbi:MAG: hypothetical protein KGJ87_11270 [Planctomycetota bacterium]|nr:hypothetical protein [Planctomycetota bacterium]